MKVFNEEKIKNEEAKTEDINTEGVTGEPQNKGEPDKKENKKNKDKKGGIGQKLAYVLSSLLALAVLALGVDIFSAFYYDKEIVDYRVFQEQLASNNVNVVYLESDQMRWVTFEDSNKFINEIREEKKKALKDGEELSEIVTVEERTLAANKVKKLYETNYPYYDDFRKDLLECGVVIIYRSFSSVFIKYMTILISAVPVIIMGGLLWVVMQQSSGSLFGKGKTVTATRDKSITFKDVIGLDENIEDIKFTLNIIKNKKMRKKHNLRAPKGLLLAGPPGTGKTMIAKAISNELKINMISVDSSSLIQLYVGLGAMRVREIFKEARQRKPCIIFFDEIDAIGTERGNSRGNSENDQTLNALLQEMDGFDSESGIFVIAATNRIDALDKALLRPGRFDKKIIINPPRNNDNRLKLYEHYLKGEDLSNVDLKTLAKQSSGFTGADIAQVTNEAKMIAVANNQEYLTTKILEEAIDKIWFKGNRTKTAVDKDKEITAYHESGHALSSILNNMPVARISIVPNTSGVGGMVVNEDDDTAFTTKEVLRNRIKMAYGGRIAEELIYGKDKITTGASADIRMATNVIRAYIEEYGFDSDIGMIDVTSMIKAGYLLENNVTDKISKLSKELYDESYKQIESNMDILHKMASLVKQEETIDGTRLMRYYEQFIEERNSERISLAKE